MGIFFAPCLSLKEKQMSLLWLESYHWTRQFGVSIKLGTAQIISYKSQRDANEYPGEKTVLLIMQLQS